MIKIFRGAGMVKPSEPPPPTSNFCFYPLPVLRCFWKDLLMTARPHHPTSSIFHCYPFPTKNFDHTLNQRNQDSNSQPLKYWEDSTVIRWCQIMFRHLKGYRDTCKYSWPFKVFNKMNDFTKVFNLAQLIFGTQPKEITEKKEMILSARLNLGIW